jgi:hypothetical protein
MRVDFEIIDAHKKEDKVLNQGGESLELNVEYSVPCSDLFVAFSDEESQKIRKIDHIIGGKIKYKNLVFNVIVGVVISSDYVDKAGIAKSGIHYLILAQNVTDYNATGHDYCLQEVDLFGSEPTAVDFKNYRIVNIGEYNMIKQLRKTDSIQEAFNQSNDTQNLI